MTNTVKWRRLGTSTQWSTRSRRAASWKTWPSEFGAEGRAAVRRSYEALFTAFPDLSPDSEGFAYGDDVFVTWGTVHGTLDGEWLGLAPKGRSFTCAFTNVVPFVEGKMQGERLMFDVANLCSQVALAVEDVLAAAARAREGSSTSGDGV